MLAKSHLDYDDQPKVITLLKELEQIFGGGPKLAVNGRHVSFMEPGYHNISLGRLDSFGDISARELVAK